MLHRVAGVAVGSLTACALLGLGLIAALPTSVSAAENQPETPPSISGKVSGYGGTALDPSSKIDVFAYRVVTGRLQTQTPAGTGHVDASGFFNVEPPSAPTLPRGEYQLFFSDNSDKYLGQFFVQHPLDSEPSTVTVGDGRPAAPVSAALAVGGVLQGKVSGPRKAPLDPGSKISLTVVDASGRPGPFRVLSDGSLAPASQAPIPVKDDGSYRTPPLRPGSYSLNVSDSAGTYADFRGSAKGTVKDAQTTTLHEEFRGSAKGTVKDAQTTTLHETAQLEFGASISGSVTGADGASLETGTRLNVVAHPTGNGKIHATRTQQDGSFRISGLSAGSYLIEFQSTDVYAGWWDGGTKKSDATPVNVRAGEEKQLEHAISATKYGSLTGLVRGPEDKALSSDHAVNAHLSLVSGRAVSSQLIAPDGTFGFSGLPAGTYRLRFSHNARVYVGQAAIVEIRWNATTERNATLKYGGTIRGTVTDPADPQLSPGSAIVVSAYDKHGDEVGSAPVDASGAYRIDGLAPGPVTLRFFDRAGHYALRWSGGQPTRGNAQRVEVVAGTEVAADNEVLGGAGAAISGTVSGLWLQEGDTRQAAHIRAYDARGALVSDVEASEDGHYTISGLAAGSYRLGFGSALGDEIFWHVGTSLARADALRVAEGQTLEIGDINLGHGLATPGAVTDVVAAPAGDREISLSWKAPDSDGGSPIIDYVLLYSFDGSTWSRVLEDVSTETHSTVQRLSNTPYQFRIAAENQIGIGPYTDPTNPGMPFTLTAAGFLAPPDQPAEVAEVTGGCGSPLAGAGPSCWLSFG